MDKINTNREISIYDGNSNGDEFQLDEIIFENDNIIVATFKNLWYINPLTAMIYKKDNVVVCNELNSYFAKNT